MLLMYFNRSLNYTLYYKSRVGLNIVYIFIIKICITSNTHTDIYIYMCVCVYIYIYIYIQGVPGGMYQTSGECSLC